MFYDIKVLRCITGAYANLVSSKNKSVNHWVLAVKESQVFARLKEGAHAEAFEAGKQRPLRSPFECLRVTPMLDIYKKYHPNTYGETMEE